MNRALLLVLALASGGVTSAQSTARVSVSSSGVQAHGTSSEAAVSAEGRWIAFASSAEDLVPDDTNGWSDVFVHDRQDGSTTRVSLDEDGTELNGNAWGVALATDGNTVAFEAWVQPFPGYNGTLLYVRDWQDAASQLVASHMVGGAFEASLSHDGRFLAYDFREDPFNFVSAQIYVLDRQDGQTAVASVSTNGVKGDGPSSAPALSADGRYVAFASDATNLVGGDSNGLGDIFVHDVDGNTTVRVSVSSTGVEANGGSRRPAVSADGRWVAFESWASNLISGDVNSRSDVFVHDLATGATLLASVASSGAQADDECWWPSISADGSRVLFGSYATNLVPLDTNATSDVFLRDVVLGTTERVSVDSAGQEGDGQSWPQRSSLSADGLRIGFHSQATNLVGGDTNGSYVQNGTVYYGIFDVFLRDQTLACSPLATYCTAKTNSLGCVPAIGASGLPLLSGNDAFFVVAEQVLSNKNGMLFWGSAPAAKPFGGGTMCVQAPVVRTPLQSSGGNPPPTDCSGTYSYHFAQAYYVAKGIGPGITLHAQFWSRDPGFALPNNVGLTDAVSFTTCP